ncbi:hypothetical protein DL98DRAFT_530843 [Cadophora sp. DSE1049]|nr:hypothetical protein DL98DRAFT_530843 [Cadophora sp. DSE1049]
MIAVQIGAHPSAPNLNLTYLNACCQSGTTACERGSWEGKGNLLFGTGACALPQWNGSWDEEWNQVDEEIGSVSLSALRQQAAPPRMLSSELAVLQSDIPSADDLLPTGPTTTIVAVPCTHHPHCHITEYRIKFVEFDTHLNHHQSKKSSSTGTSL